MTTQLEALAAQITWMGTAERLRFAADLIVVAGLEPESRRAATLGIAEKAIERSLAEVRLGNVRRVAR